MKVKSKISQADCTLGTSYGFAQNNAWVDKGCRADFVICFNQGELLICFLPESGSLTLVGGLLQHIANDRKQGIDSDAMFGVY